MMQSDKIKRYPGGRPFTKDMAKLFFGRKEDLKKLHQLVSLEKLVVLHGRSGLGKSSLINAGLMPKLQEDENNECIQFRFNAWTEATKKTPLNTTLEALKDIDGDPSIINKIIPSDDSVWRIIKERQFKKPDSRQILIFDQFEELFSYPKDQVHQFKSQIAELIRKQVPKRYEQILNIGYNRGQDVITVEEEDALYRDLNVRILFIIRSDKMHLLDQLSDYLPTIFKNNHELKALQIGGATDAIVKPATLEGDHFQSQKFSYTPAAQNKIIDFLQDKDTHLIEAIQLQIVCTSFEENVISKGWDQLDENNIGDLNSIVQNYYYNKIESLDTADEKLQAARLLEDGLVDNQRRQRLTLHESQIVDLFKVEQDLLDKLINIHLLRRELDQNGGYNYELSHDTLIGPALMAKEVREQKENEEERIRQQKELAQEKAKRRRANLFSYAMVALALISAFSFFRQYMQSKELIKKETMLEDQNNELEKQFNALAESEDARKIALQDAKDNEEEAKAQAIEANRQKLKAEEESRKADRERKEAEKQKLKAEKAEEEALDNFNKAVASEKQSNILGLISQAKLLFSKGNRAEALQTVKVIWELDPEREDLKLLIKEMARSPMPIVYADASTEPRLMHSPKDLLVTNTFIFNPRTLTCRDIDTDEILLSDDQKYLLGISYESKASRNYTTSHRKQGSLENFKKAKYQLYDGNTGAYITSFQHTSDVNVIGILGNDYTQLASGAITTPEPESACFLAIDYKKDKVLSIKEITSNFFNSAIWNITDLNGDLLTSFGKKFSSNKNGQIESVSLDFDNDNHPLYNEIRNNTSLVDFTSSTTSRILTMPVSHISVESINDYRYNEDGVCVIKNAYMRMEDYAAIPFVEFKVGVDYCYEAPSLFKAEGAKNPCDFQNPGRQYGEDLWDGTSLDRGYYFSSDYPYAMFWDNEGNAGIWDLNEIRIADFLPGEYHGYTWSDKGEMILTKLGDKIYVWDDKGKLIKDIEGEKMHMYSLDRYMVLKNDTVSYIMNNGDSIKIKPVLVENFAGYNDKGFSTQNVGGATSVGGPINYSIEERWYSWAGDLYELDGFNISQEGDFVFNYGDSIPDVNNNKVYTRIDDKQLSIYLEGSKLETLVDAISLQDFVYRHYFIGNNLIVITEDRRVKIFPIQLDFDPKAYLDSKIIDWQ